MVRNKAGEEFRLMATLPPFLCILVSLMKQKFGVEEVLIGTAALLFWSYQV